MSIEPRGKATMPRTDRILLFGTIFVSGIVVLLNLEVPVLVLAVVALAVAAVVAYLLHRPDTYATTVLWLTVAAMMVGVALYTVGLGFPMVVVFPLVIPVMAAALKPGSEGTDER